jgi:hypothetical protein
LEILSCQLAIFISDMRTQRGHPFAAGLALSKLSAFTVDDRGKETFATGGDLDRVKKVYCFGAH